MKLHKDIQFVEKLRRDGQISELQYWRRLKNLWRRQARALRRSRDGNAAGLAYWKVRALEAEQQAEDLRDRLSAYESY